MSLILLQNVADSLTNAAGAGATKLSLLGLLMKGGYFMIPLLLLSILAIYIFIERYIIITKASRVNDSFMQRVKDYMLGGNIKAAISVCHEEDTPTSRMIEKGLKRIGKPIKDIEVAIENVGKLELLQLEKRLATLATIAGAAPMIGFLGTVTGMIRAFYNLSSAGTNIDPGLLAGGIYEAMLTTAAGLAVGIIAYIGYNVLVAMVEKVIYKMEATSVAFLDVLQEPV